MVTRHNVERVGKGQSKNVKTSECNTLIQHYSVVSPFIKICWNTSNIVITMKPCTWKQQTHQYLIGVLSKLRVCKGQSKNVNTLTQHYSVGSPFIKICWNTNYIVITMNKLTWKWQTNEYLIGVLSKFTIADHMLM